MAKVRDLMAAQSETVRREAELSNVPVIAGQLERFRSRLGYWEARLRLLRVHGAGPTEESSCPEGQEWAVAPPADWCGPHEATSSDLRAGGQGIRTCRRASSLRIADRSLRSATRRWSRGHRGYGPCYARSAKVTRSKGPLGGPIVAASGVKREHTPHFPRRGRRVSCPASPAGDYRSPSAVRTPWSAGRPACPFQRRRALGAYIGCALRWVQFS